MKKSKIRNSTLCITDCDLNLIEDVIDYLQMYQRVLSIFTECDLMSEIEHLAYLADNMREALEDEEV